MPFIKLIRALRVEETLIYEKLRSRITQLPRIGLTGVLTDDDWRAALSKCSQALSEYMLAQDQPELLKGGSRIRDLPKTLGIQEAQRCRAGGVKLDVSMRILKALRSVFFELIDETIRRSGEAKLAISITSHFLDEMEVSFCSHWTGSHEMGPGSERQIDAANTLQERSLYHAIFHSIAEPSFVVREETFIAEVNKSFEKFFGVPRQSALGKKCSEVLSCGVCERCPLEMSVKNKSSFSDFVTVLPINGNPKTVSVSGSAAMNESGDYLGTLIIVRDLTDRNAQREVLLNIAEGVSHSVGESFFRHLVESIGKTLGVDYALVGKLCGDDFRKVRTMAVLARGKIVENFEYDLTHTPCDNVVNKGMCFYPENVQQLFPRDPLLCQMEAVSYIGIPLRDTKERVLGVMAILHSRPLVNVPLAEAAFRVFAARASAELERALAEKRLLESKEYLDKIINSISDPVFAKDEEHRLVLVNDALCGLMGRSRDEILGRTDHDFFPSEQVEVFREKDDAVFATGEENINEEEFTDGNGTVHTVVTKKTLYIDKAGHKFIVGIIRDMTERKLVEDALLESEGKYRSLYSSMTEGVALHEIDYSATGEAVDYRILDVNPAYESITGLRKEDVLGGKASAIYGTGKPPYLDTYARVAATGESTSFKTFFPPMEKHLAVSVFSPGPGRFATVFEDITERQRAEEQCAKLATAVEQASELIMVTDTKGVIRYVNPAFEKNTGYTREEVLGRTPNILKSGKHDHQFYENLWSTISQGQVWKGHLVNRKKNGALYEEEATITPMRDTLGNIINYVAVKRDVTTERELEMRLIQAHKMEAIGTLASGIAHDFNNILAAIMGYTEMTINKVTGIPVAYDNLQQVIKATRRARELVQQILLFSRRGVQERRPVRIDLIISEALKLLRASLPTTIEIRHNLSSEHTALILADSTQIHQVLMNLCSNAAHAMREKGGTLSIALEEVSLETAGELLYPGLGAGNYVRVTVSDTGHGMSRNTMKRIFDPFFTTKKSGEGTGMGLAVVLGIVENHGGSVTVQSEPGHGSSFQIHFPRIEQTIEAESDVLASIPKGKGRVLFVDDEQSLVELAEQMLDALGYDVVAEVNSVRALELFRARPDQFDLVVTDYTMPNMTGIDLALEVMRIRQDIPVILCTGFSDMINAEKAKAQGIREFIMKPLTLGEVARAIAGVLDKGEVSLHQPGKEIKT